MRYIFLVPNKNTSLSRPYLTLFPHFVWKIISRTSTSVLNSKRWILESSYRTKYTTGTNSRCQDFVIQYNVCLACRFLLEMDTVVCCNEHCDEDWSWKRLVTALSLFVHSREQSFTSKDTVSERQELDKEQKDRIPTLVIWSCCDDVIRGGGYQPRLRTNSDTNYRKATCCFY